MKIQQFYTFTNLQGSQTERHTEQLLRWFYTFTNLQGSQTSNEVITEPEHIG